MPKSLSRKDNHRKSLLRNLATSLILYEEIKTTETKAKEIKPIVERLIHVAKKNDLVSRRRLLGYLFDENAVNKTYDVLLPRYKKIPSGFVKIYKIGPRLGDSAQMVIIKLEPAQVEEYKVDHKAISDQRSDRLAPKGLKDINGKENPKKEKPEKSNSKTSGK